MGGKPADEITNLQHIKIDEKITIFYIRFFKV